MEVGDRLQPAGLVIEVSEIAVHEADEPEAVVDLFDADFLSGEDLAEVDLLSLEAGAPARGDGDGLSWKG